MDQFQPEKILRQVPEYEEYARKVSRGIHQKVLDGGTPARRVADFLHGTWLGHPLHPVLTDFVIGAWLVGSVLDLMSMLTKSRSVEKAADTLTTLGTVGAVPTALTGLTDYTTIKRGAMTTGATHGLINTLGLALYLLSMRARSSGRRERGVFFSAMALALITVSAWLGGELVYKYGVGVNKNQFPKEPKDWTAVIDAQELKEHEPRRVEVEGRPVLLYRHNGAVQAISAVCAHEGGPLDEGKFEGYCVECPWHQSVFDLRDGSVVHGPSTYAVPAYTTRILNGKVEVKLKED